MEIEHQTSSTVEVKFVKLTIPTRDDDSRMPLDAPLRHRNSWTATIDLETGVIQDWQVGRALKFCIKVNDQGYYYLLSPTQEVVATLEQWYAPDFIPDHSGDYVDFKISENGKIENWKVPHQDDFSAFYDRGKFV